MGKYLDLDNEGYAEIRSMPYFVDKTGLLRITNRALDGDDRFFCVSRPRRFGKTLAAEMITSYYSRGCDSSSLFDGLNISTSPDYLPHLNRHHVIFFSVLAMDASLEQYQSLQELGLSQPDRNWLSMDVVDFITYSLIKELQATFPNCFAPGLIIPDILYEIRQSQEDHPKFIIVIDEWDHIFRKYTDQPRLQGKYISFLISLFKHSHSSRFISLAYLTGIYPIKKYGIQSGLNVFKEYTMITPEDLEEYTGFTEEETAELCSRSGLSLEEMKKWYDGYRFMGHFSAYCPASVVYAARNRRVSSYWSHTESYDDIKTYIDLDIIGLRPAIARLLKGETLTCNTTRFSNNAGEPKTRDELLTMLIHLGYLTCVSINGDTAQLAIPNREIRNQFENNTKEDERWLRIFAVLNQSVLLLHDTWAGNSEKVAKKIEEAHFLFTATQNYNAEEALRCVVLNAYYSAEAYYKLEIEPDMGFGRADIFFNPLLLPDSTPAIPMLVELKWNKSADSAIQQIKDRQYARTLTEWPDVLLVGINYDPDTRKHTCVIEHHHPNKA